MNIDKFVLFFERSNSIGIALNFLDILTAKLHEGFKLRKEIQNFKNSNLDYNLNPETIVRTIAYIVSSEKSGVEGKGIEIHRSFILSELNAGHFNKYWNSVCIWYKQVLDFLYKNNFIISQAWIPYENLVIPLMIFLKEIGGGFDKTNEEQSDFIHFWFWAAIFSARFTGSTNERIIDDSNIFKQIARSQKITNISYFNRLFKSQITSNEDILSYNRKANAIYKGILNLINYHSKGLIDWNSTNKLNFNDELEDHHIFPTAYIEKTFRNMDVVEFKDCVANRTLIPKGLNLKIRDKAPSVYLKEIQNRNIQKSLANHLILNEIVRGDYDKDFDFFIKYRCEEIFHLIDKYYLKKRDDIKQKFYKKQELKMSGDTSIYGKYYNNIIKAKYNPYSGKVLYNGHLFESPSGAAQQAKIDNGAHSETTANGWKFWRYKDMYGQEHFIDELREYLEN